MAIEVDFYRPILPAITDCLRAMYRPCFTSCLAAMRNLELPFDMAVVIFNKNYIYYLSMKLNNEILIIVYYGHGWTFYRLA